MSKKVLWKNQPLEEDYDAALSFLTLVFPEATAAQLVQALHKARTLERPAKDLLRASGLPLLPDEEAHVSADLKRIHKGKALSPVLLIQGNLEKAIALTVADGYHRICAVCYYDESAPIACRLVPLATSQSRSPHRVGGKRP
jgi:hypothetical protein